MKPLISIVVPTYNRREILKVCLERLLNQSYPSDQYEIIVVDDGSTDGSRDLVASLTSSASTRILYLLQNNEGPGRARNTGIRNASGEIVLFLDDDSLADRYLLEGISDAFNASSDNIVAVRGRVKGLALDESKSEFIEMLDKYVYNDKRSWATNNLAYKRSVLGELGGFDESFRQCEDIDLGARVRDRGYDQVYSDNALVWHLHETDMDMFRRKWMLGGMGLRVYFRKWLRLKPRRALMVFYNQIIKVGIRGFISGNYLIKEQFKSTLKGFMSNGYQIKTKYPSQSS